MYRGQLLIRESVLPTISLYTAVMKKTKSAKNRKKGWKKLDTSAVEDFIEDQRLQERTGYGILITISNCLHSLGNRVCS